jgi:SagB-type dehydrogenase family enzyme
MHDSITLAQLSTALEFSTRPIPADFLAPGERLNDLYVIANAVEGLDPGSYVFARDPLRLELLKSGMFRDEARYLGLEQALAGDAAAAIFFLADLDAVLERFGNRGYRAAQLEAGILGGRLYLAAYAQRLGASGLTFYDDDVVAFFSPHAASKAAIFLVALGHPAKRLRTL